MNNPRYMPGGVISALDFRREWLARADAILAAPPALHHIRRPVPRGSRVARFAIPIELCKTTNRTRGAAGWALGRAKSKLATMMGFQCAARREPLPGRPQVLCVRFSSSEPDAYSDWAKAAVDVLTMRTPRAQRRLGLIRDDKPSAAEVVQWWEPAPPRKGFVVIEVWTGEDVA